jgi:hypothetical protein
MSYYNSHNLTVDDLVSKTFVEVRNVDNQSILLKVSDDEAYTLYHSQDCCESVWVEEIHGDLDDLVGTPLLVSEERSEMKSESYDQEEWTFYTFATVKGWVTIRFVGTSNGYYSTSVYLGRVH